MAFEVAVPPAGESIKEGMLVEWSAADGAVVQAEEPLFVLETDKVTLAVNAPRSGRLKVLVGAGEMVKIGQVVATIDEAVEMTADGGRQTADGPRSAVGGPPSVAVPPIAPVAGIPQMRGKVAGKALEDLSPAVRRLVAEKGLDPSRIESTGKGGRLTKEDVVHYLGADEGRGTRGEGRTADEGRGTSSLPTADGRWQTTAPGVRQVRSAMSPIRQRIAERLLESQRTTATLTTFNEADLSALLELRKRFREPFKAKHGVDLGFLPFFVKAVVEGLEAVPALRTVMDGAELVRNDYYDIGIAVAAEHGLAVPVVREADKKSLAQIQGEIEELARRVREKRITLSELQGAVFSISNAGSYGALMGTPILNPPQAGILGMYTIQERPVAREGKIEIRPMMYLALSYDHRIVDGKEAGTFLKRVAENVEKPGRYSLELD